jgi:hypothetical protein
MSAFGFSRLHRSTPSGSSMKRNIGGYLVTTLLLTASRTPPIAARGHNYAAVMPMVRARTSRCSPHGACGRIVMTMCRSLIARAICWRKYAITCNSCTIAGGLRPAGSLIMAIGAPTFHSQATSEPRMKDRSKRHRKPRQGDRDRAERARRQHQEQVLDEALENTFPASDPVSIVQPAPPEADFA